MSVKCPTVVSVLNLKGGVGKTTVAALLARFASGTGGYQMRGQKSMDVLAVDLDPQANLSQALMGEGTYKKFMANKEPAIVDLFNGFRPASRVSPGPTRLQSGDIIQSVVAPGAEGKLEIVPSRFDFSDKLTHSLNTDEQVLARFIARDMQHKDLIVIDCAPTESILTRAAYHASRYILIPVKTEFMATIGFPLMYDSLDVFRRRNSTSIVEVCGVLINRNRTKGAELGPHHRTAMKEIRDHANEYGWPVLRHHMPHSDGFPKWAKDRNATYLGDARDKWPNIARDILRAINL